MTRITLVLTALVAWLLLPGHSTPAAAAAPGAGWVPPLEGPLRVRRGFDRPAQDWNSGHRGVDLAGAAGAVVRAAGAGTVTFAGVLAGRGVITVSHGDLRTTYEPVTATVTVGTAVSVGAPVGRLAVGHGLPRPGETLLHWGLRRGDDYLDPLGLLHRAPPRLLPQWGSTAAGAGHARPRGVAGPHVAAAAVGRPEADRRATAGSGGASEARGVAAIAAAAVATGVAAQRSRRRG